LLRVTSFLYGDHINRLLLLLLIALAGGCAQLRTNSSAVAADLALRHVNVVDVENGRAIPDQTVLIAGNRIRRLGPSTRVRVPSRAQVIDARGRYLIPGLWDMHVHSSSDQITRETLLPLYVANGVTGVRDMKGDCYDPCWELESSIEQVQTWRQEIADRTLVGPRIVAGSHLIQTPLAGEPSRPGRPTTEAEARHVVRQQKERGVDFLKVYDWNSRETYFALADEAAKQGLRFVGHVPIAVRASEASDAGQHTMEHLQGILQECNTREDELREQIRAGPPPPGTLFMMAESFSETKCAALYARFVENRTWQVPTLTVLRGAAEWRSDPRVRYLSHQERDYWEEESPMATRPVPEELLERRKTLWERRLHIVGAMHRAGVSILAGSDVGFPPAFAGFGLHDELELLVAAGLTTADALRAATSGPARFLEATDSLGTVAVGKLADLVLLEGNPLDDIRNTRQIRAVVLNGRLFDRRALDQLLGEVETAVNREGAF
jgi:hypothetical protein